MASRGVNKAILVGNLGQDPEDALYAELAARLPILR
jgi:hypothetical protein